eukprot:317249-Prorocentrum_lima.AAC.1
MATYLARALWWAALQTLQKKFPEAHATHLVDDLSVQMAGPTTWLVAKGHEVVRCIMRMSASLGVKINFTKTAVVVSGKQ